MKRIAMLLAAAAGLGAQPVITTFAGGGTGTVPGASVNLALPGVTAIVFDFEQRNLYIAQGNRILRSTPTGLGACPRIDGRTLIAAGRSVVVA